MFFVWIVTAICLGTYLIWVFVNDTVSKLCAFKQTRTLSSGSRFGVAIYTGEALTVLMCVGRSCQLCPSAGLGYHAWPRIPTTWLCIPPPLPFSCAEFFVVEDGMRRPWTAELWDVSQTLRFWSLCVRFSCMTYAGCNKTMRWACCII